VVKTESNDGISVEFKAGEN